MKFSDLECCPFCGNDEFMTNDRYYGTSEYNRRFDGKIAYDNSAMYDGLIHERGNKAVCNSCFRYLGNPNTDVLGKAASRRINELVQQLKDEEK